MERYICIHGHFYQPPRENPWLETLEVQDSAYPYHDWNERITAECYARNACSRILDNEGRMISLVNNYSRISFNFGPTLLSWMESQAPQVYQSILQADVESRERFSGHGSALAQVYNHVILPLANSRDKYTQIYWGLKDFEHRFGRKPEGMWLSETAVDLECLEIMAELGILFTILAPRQAKSVRPLGESEWQDVSEGRIDPTMAYSCLLPSGRTIALFFYDGPVSQAIAFENLLFNGEELAQRLMGAFSEERRWPQLVHIATDGESYGHHHPDGDMALAYALHRIETEDQVRLTNYGEYLEKHPPTHEVEIFQNSSWSCIHGVERWRSDCGCNSGGYPEWNQAWRAPLRDALDWLRDTLEAAYEELGGELLKDPWVARNDYIRVILDRSTGNVRNFIKVHAFSQVRPPDPTTVLKLMELQRHAMLMYTSCGWFFDELSGIETIQIIEYAARVVQLARQLFGGAVEPRFVQLLARAKSNIPENRDGRHMYNTWVKPAMIDLTRVCAHYAVDLLFQGEESQTQIGPYRVKQEDLQLWQTGRAKLIVGRATFSSEITLEEGELSFGVLHLGDHNISCGVRDYQGEARYSELVEEISDPFERADFPGTILVLDKHFGSSTYSLTSLFRDEQRRALEMILQPPLEQAEMVYAQLYEQHAPLTRFLAASGKPAPKQLAAAAEFVLNAQLRRALEASPIDPRHVESILEDMKVTHVSLDHSTMEYHYRKNLERMSRRLLEEIHDLQPLRELAVATSLLKVLPFQVNLRQVQDTCFQALQHFVSTYGRKLAKKDKSAAERMKLMSVLAERLWIHIPEEVSS